MKILDKIRLLGSKKTTTPAAVKPKERVSVKLTAANTYPVELEMQDFDYALRRAEDVLNPNRLLLYLFYKRTSKDTQVLSQVRTAYYTVQQAPFAVTDGTKENEQYRTWFETQWFLDFVRHCLDTEFWGHSLIEFSDIENDNFAWVKLIPREHVRPETQEVLIDVLHTNGISYADNVNDWFLIEVGDKRDLGIYEIATREVIWKYYARSDWSRATERYGMPLLAIKTGATEKDELDAIENFAKNFGNNGYVVLSKEDDIEIQTQSGGSNFQEMYKTKADFCDAQISKLINGQTGSSDEKAYVGSAEVHERILNTYTLARLQRIQNIINDRLIPFMTAKGFPLTGYKFQYTELLEKQTEEPETTKKKNLTYTY